MAILATERLLALDGGCGYEQRDLGVLKFHDGKRREALEHLEKYEAWRDLAADAAPQYVGDVVNLGGSDAVLAAELQVREDEALARVLRSCARRARGTRERRCQERRGVAVNFFCADFFSRPTATYVSDVVTTLRQHVFVARSSSIPTRVSRASTRGAISNDRRRATRAASDPRDLAGVTSVLSATTPPWVRAHGHDRGAPRAVRAAPARRLAGRDERRRVRR